MLLENGGHYHNPQPPITTGEVVYNCLDGMTVFKDEWVKRNTSLPGIGGGYPVYVETYNYLAIEFLLCEAISTSLVNAIQYTLSAQLIGAAIFLLVIKVCFYGPSVLTKNNTYTNVFENKGNVENQCDEEACCDSGDERIPIADNVNDKEIAASNPMQSKASNSEKFATYLLRNSAPKSKYKLIGVWSWSFIFLYIATLGATFAVLMWYFLEGGCESQIVNVSKSLSADTYRNSYTKAGRHLCTSNTTSYVAVPDNPNPPLGMDISFHIP